MTDRRGFYLANQRRQGALRWGFRMAIRTKLGGLCQALLVAASVTALSAGAAQAQGDDLAALSQQILDNPTDVSLNLRYAEAAEAAGKPRLALAAYERVLINDPSNVEAHQGYE